MSARTTTSSNVMAPILHLFGEGTPRVQAYITPPPQSAPVYQSQRSIPEPALGQTVPDLNGLDQVISQLKSFDWLPFIQKISQEGAATSTAAATFRETALSPDDTVIEDALHLLCYYFLGAKNRSRMTSLADLMREYSFNQISATDLTMVLKRFLVDGNQVPPYLTDDQRAKSGDVTTLNARTKKQLVNMYLRVLELIKAILVRMCREDGDSASSSTESITAHALVMRAWSLVLGQLDCLRCVLVHGHDRGFIDLGAYPREWSVIIEETVGYIHECAERVRRVEQTAIPLRQDEFQYQVAMDDVRKRFDAHIQALHAAEAERIRLQQELERALRPDLWLKRYNVGDTEKILSSGSTPFGRTSGDD